MIQVVSFGAGINSTALLIGMKERGLRPDAILFADTGGEFPETYKHLDTMRNWVEDNGFPKSTIVKYYESRHATLEGECLNNETLPSKAFGLSGCSVKWKRQPMDKFLKTWKPAVDAWDRGERVMRLIGIHHGEKKRGKIPDTEEYRFVYPLREWKWDQVHCEAACARAGITLPRKSSCFFCPSMKKHEVLELSVKHPDLMERALEIEANAQENLETVRGLGRTWTWAELIAADDAKRARMEDMQSPLCDACMG